MDIILNYLDSMFTRLPDTEAVRKAKREMASMMEDKLQNFCLRERVRMKPLEQL